MNDNTNQPVDIAKIVFDAIFQDLPIHDEAFTAVLDAAGITKRQHGDIHDSGIAMVVKVMESAFIAGWRMRGQV